MPLSEVLGEFKYKVRFFNAQNDSLSMIEVWIIYGGEMFYRNDMGDKTMEL